MGNQVPDSLEAISLRATALGQSLFGGALSNINRWPGWCAYLNHVEWQITKTNPVCFEPLWKAFGLEESVTAKAYLELMRLVVDVLHENPVEGLSIDEILGKVLLHYGHDVRRLDAKSLESSRQAIFKSFLWVAMLVESPSEYSEAKLKVTLPVDVRYIRGEQAMENAKKPLSRLIRGFGQVLPPVEQIVASIENLAPDLIYATQVNLHSLRMIDKVRIQWTSSLAYHLMFDTLTRTLQVFRFPSLCALSCVEGPQGTVVDQLLSECFQGLEQDASAFTKYKLEVLLSYRLLFGQNRKSRQYFRRIETKKVIEFREQYDPLLDILCGDPASTMRGKLPSNFWPEFYLDAKGKLLEQDVYSTAIDFPMLGLRLLKIQHFDARQQPSRIRDLWRDRRHPTQWYAFWAVLIIGGLSILLSILQLIVSTLQLVWTIK